jgi:hypothetical protein
MSKVGLGFGVALLATAVFILGFRPEIAGTWGVGLAFVGLGSVFTSLLYWGCGNKSCSPWD